MLLQLPGCEAHVVSQAHKADDVAITVRVGMQPEQHVALVADRALVSARAGLTLVCGPGR